MKKFLLALGLTVGLATPASAQLTTLNGNECWNAGVGTGGTAAGFLCVNLVRGGTANTVLSAVTGNLTIGAASGNFTVTGAPAMANLSQGGNVLLTAQPSAATWTWPANPVADGAIVGVCNAGTSAWSANAQTPAANSGQTMPLTTVFTTLAAGACVRYQWNQSQATWYRVQ